jgi:hypothetical protein
MNGVGGAIKWMGFDGIMLDTEVELQNWQWTGPGGLSSQALTNTLVASRAKAWVQALNAGAGFDVPLYIYMSLPQAAQFPGGYCQYFCAYEGNDVGVANAITNSVYPAFVYGMATGTTAPIINGDTIFYDVASVTSTQAPFGTGASTGAAATTSWNAALNMTLNGAATYTFGGVSYPLQGFKNQRVNLRGSSLPLPSNAYLSPMCWVGDGQDGGSASSVPPWSVWTTDQWNAAIGPILKYSQHNTFAIFQGGQFIDYSNNTRFGAPGYNYTPVNG